MSTMSVYRSAFSSDALATQGLLAALNQAQGLTVVLVSHEVALAREFAGETIGLRDGRVESRERVR